MRLTDKNEDIELSHNIFNVYDLGSLFRKSGVLAIARKGQPGLDLYIESLNKNGVPYDLLTGEEANRRYPQQLKLPSDCWCIYEADGGVLKASLALKTLQVFDV